jgi:hypothetical protein
VAPGVAPMGSASLPAPVAPAPQRRAQVATKPSATPGFTF